MKVLLQIDAETAVGPDHQIGADPDVVGDIPARVIDGSIAAVIGSELLIY